MTEHYEPMKQTSQDKLRLKETQLIEFTGRNGAIFHLVVEFTIHQGKIGINGCRLYSPDGRYTGWWPGFDIPRHALAEMRASIEDGTFATRFVFNNEKGYKEALEHL
jgi:hypothetical protein